MVLLLLVCWFHWLGYFKFHSHFTHFCALCESLCSLSLFDLSSLAVLSTLSLLLFSCLTGGQNFSVFFGQLFGPMERGCPRRVFVCFFFWTFDSGQGHVLLRLRCLRVVYRFLHLRLRLRFCFQHTRRGRTRAGRGSGALKHNGNG